MKETVLAMSYTASTMYQLQMVLAMSALVTRDVPAFWTVHYLVF